MWKEENISSIVPSLDCFVADEIGGSKSGEVEAVVVETVCCFRASASETCGRQVIRL